jgi:uncharacterized protein
MKLAMMKVCRNLGHIILFFTIVCLGPLSMFGEDIPDKPSPAHFVNDLANILSNEEVSEIEYKLQSYFDSTSTQIVVVTVPSLNGYDISDFSFKLGHKWGIGQKDKDNGIVFLIAPTERKCYIATGYGMEEKLTDGICNRIIYNSVLPYFKQKDYSGGIQSGVDAIIERMSGVYQNDEDSENAGNSGVLFKIFILFIIIIVLFSIFGGGGGGTYSGRGFQSGGFGGPFFGGGFGSGSSGGGGFSFGGGDFGGGGSGGSW